ncbi:MAG TPA: hypothetical protein VIL01_13835 [Thermomicrobiales bacterium]
MSETADARQTVRHATDDPSTDDDSIECRFVQDLAAPFALAAVETHERLLIEQHILFCASCARVVRQFRSSAALLGLTNPVATPSPKAKAALFARINEASRTQSQLRPATAYSDFTESMRTLTLPASRPNPSPAPSPAQPATRRFSPSWLRLPRPAWEIGTFAAPLATVPLLLALGIVGLWAINTRVELNDRIAEVQQLSAQVDSLNSQVAALNESLESMDRFVAAADAKTYVMTPSAAAGSSGAYGQVIANPNTDQAMLMVWRLSGSNPRYDVVLETHQGTIEPAGELVVNAEGKGVTVLDLDRPFAMYRSVHVKPQLQDSTAGTSDTISRADALFAVIDPNLGSTDDTDGILMQSP